MGCSFSAISDDMDDWSSLSKEAKVSDMKWDVYSDEAGYAKIGFSSHNFTGRRLKLFVKQQVELDQLKRKHANEVEDLKTLSKLESKYA